MMLGAAACTRDSEATERTPPAEDGTIIIAPAKLGALTIDSVRTRWERLVAVVPAQIVPDEDHMVRVIPPISGRIRSVDVSLGMHVEAGQPLAHIASGDLAQATSDVAKAEAQLAQATANLRRTRDLYEHNVTAAKDVEQARTDEAQARAEAERARARARMLGAGGPAVAGDFVLRAPMSGDVIDRAANPGAEVRSDAATPLFTISSLDALWVTANVYQRELAVVRRGSRLVFETDAVPGKQFEARVVTVSGALDPQTHTATLRATLPNPGHVLRVLETGTAKLYASDATPALVVPTRALVTHGSSTVVFVEVGRGRFMRRVVTVGDDDGDAATITSGLTAGERIVTNGSLLLESESAHQAQGS